MKKVLSILLSFCIISAFMPITAHAAEIVASGACGDTGYDVNRTLDD